MTEAHGPARRGRGTDEDGTPTQAFPAAASFAPTDVVPAEGLPAWGVPDPARTPVAQLDPHLPVRTLERRPDGWAHVQCSNGWSAWVDGRRLLPRDDLADDEELWPTLQAALADYGRLVDEFAAGTMDGVTFAKRALGIGLIVRERDAWILDLPTKRWWRYDGMALTTVDIGELGKPRNT